MSKFNEEQVIQLLTQVKELGINTDDITKVKEIQGGLVNHVFRIETKKGLFFLVQIII